MTQRPLRVILCYPKRLGGVWIVNEALAEHLASEGITTVKVHTWTALFATLLRKSTHSTVWITNLTFGIANLLPIRCLFILHGFPRRSEGIVKFTLALLAFRILARLASRVVSVSHLTHIVNRDLLGIRTDLVIHNFLAAPPRLPQRRRNPLPNIIYVGRFVKEKRVETLIAAYAQLSANQPVGSLTLVGTGPLAGDLKRAAGGNPMIHFPGALSPGAVYDQLAASDVFVSLNELEPFGITVLEARMSGLVICIPSQGGANEFLDPGDAVHCSDPGDASAVRDALVVACARAKTHDPREYPIGTLRERAGRDYIKVLREISA